jgi:hypothetical protein
MVQLSGYASDPRNADRQLKADPKLVADQPGHTVDVSLNEYAQSPVAGRAVIVDELKMLVQ